jgi:hypothetical protein
MTRKEFIIQHKAFERGMVSAYKGMMIHAKVCMEAHKEELTRKRLTEVANMNKHLYKSARAMQKFKRER